MVAPLLLLLCTPIEKCFSHSKNIFFWCSVVLSTCHFVNLPFHQFAISLPCHFINLPFHQFAISKNCHFYNLHFHQFAIFLTHSFHTRDHEILGANLDLRLGTGLGEPTGVGEVRLGYLRASI